MTEYFRFPKPNLFWLVFLTVGLILIFGAYLSLRFGAISFSHDQLLATLKEFGKNSAQQDIIVDLRIPRLLTACLVGASLTVAGLMMQAVTYNRLADSGLLGIQAGAGLSILLLLILNPNPHYLLRLMVGFMGAGLVAGLVIFSSQQKGHSNHPLRILLIGSMTTAFLSAVGQGISIYLNQATHYLGLLSGSLTQANWSSLAWLAGPIFLALLFAMFFAKQLTILSLQESLAQGLGLQTRLFLVLFLLLVTVLSAAAVSLAGSLTFIGLIIPNLIRPFFKRDFRYLLPLSALCGACLLVWMDVLARTLHPPYELPLNSLTSLIGFPILLFLIRKGDWS
ncbi:TPA: FecCD family ABC transporter permease [Streptococcus suis]